jgi:uncharacterized membrane protein
LDSARLEAFSDGVFAVAITVLALTLAVPAPGHLSLGRQLSDHWPSFAAFAISFLTIGIIWVNHHSLFKNFAEIDRTLLFLNLMLLFFVVTIPFATATMASYLRSGGTDASWAAVIYQGVFEGMSIAFGALFWWSVKKELFKVAFTPEAGRAALIRFGAGNAGYLGAIGIAFVSAPASLLVSALVAVYYVFEHTPAASPAPEAPAAPTVPAARPVEAEAIPPGTTGSDSGVADDRAALGDD